MSSEPRKAPSQEERILRAMKMVLTRVIRETATKPGMRHPLTDECIEDMRQCLILIAAREKELVEAAGGDMSRRPRFADDPRPGPTAVIPLDQIGRKTPKPPRDEH